MNVNFIIMNKMSINIAFYWSIMLNMLLNLLLNYATLICTQLLFRMWQLKKWNYAFNTVIIGLAP